MVDISDINLFYAYSWRLTYLWFLWEGILFNSKENTVIFFTESYK